MRSVFRNAIIAAVFLISGNVALAENATGTIGDGTYATDGVSQYKDGEIDLQAWGDGYTMRATLINRGREYQVEAFLRPSARDQVSGSGYITVRYADGTGCRHRFGTRIFITENGLYLRDNMPTNIPFNPNGPCTAAGPYEWKNHAAPYLFLD